MFMVDAATDRIVTTRKRPTDTHARELKLVTRPSGQRGQPKESEGERDPPIDEGGTIITSRAVKASQEIARRLRAFVLNYNSLWTRQRLMEVEDYKTILYRQEDGSWVAEVPAIPGCYALMPTREAALAELSNVFKMLAEEYAEKGAPLPADTTEIIYA